MLKKLKKNPTKKLEIKKKLQNLKKNPEIKKSNKIARNI